MCRSMSFFGEKTWLLLIVGGLLFGGDAAADKDPFSTHVRAGYEDGVPSDRAHSSVGKQDLDRRQARSAPDAVRYETGVFVQQTAHGQGSAFIRGLTGQQTLLLFDGIRLNNSTYRQGPNQYFFTIDSQTIDGIEILRGGGSTRYGSDALGGVIAAFPLLPVLAMDKAFFKPQLSLRAASSDDEFGGRGQVQFSIPWSGGTAGFVGGVGYRNVGRLKSGGRVENPNPNTPFGRYPMVPAYAKDGITQLGTGFSEATVDGRLVLDFKNAQRLTLATYHYLQFDVPRTDQCPPPTAPPNTCLIYEKQFRHLAYFTYEGKVSRWLYPLRITVSFQHQHEKQRDEDPSVLVVRSGLDDVFTLGFLVHAKLRPVVLRQDLVLRVLYGLDHYTDWVYSTAFRTFTDTQQTNQKSRGQYVSGSVYLNGGMYVDASLSLPKQFFLFAGTRWSWVSASAPAEILSGSQAVSQYYLPWVGRIGTEWKPRRYLSVLAHFDHSFRAPNLNDLTARQQTGPGFQFENAALAPERATTFELGVVLEHEQLTAQVWGFETILQDAVLKVGKSAEDCPAQTPQCQTSWSRLQLQNAPSYSELRGVEAMIRLKTELGLSARATFTYTFGETPKIGEIGYGGYGVSVGDRVPMTRIPPINGTVEAVFRRNTFELSAGLRWAASQHRLALADYSDARIPKYGTPGYAVLDVRTSVRLADHVVLGAILENVTDAAYRNHGSSVNGGGRGFVVTMKID